MQQVRLPNWALGLHGSMSLNNRGTGVASTPMYDHDRGHTESKKSTRCWVWGEDGIIVAGCCMRSQCTGDLGNYSQAQRLWQASACRMRLWMKSCKLAVAKNSLQQRS